MKKIYFLLMLAALSATAVLHAAETGEDDYTTLSFTCSLESTLSAQMKSEMIEQVESLTVAGFLGKGDISTIDKCCHLKWLDLTNVYTTDDKSRIEEGFLYSHIERDALRHTAIETLFLPKNILSFAFQSLSLFRWDKDCGRPAADEGVTDYDGQPHFDKTIIVYVTGAFPDCFNPEPIDGYYGCPMEFHLAEGNDQYIEEEGFIYSKDKNCLYKAGHLYDKLNEECTFDVKEIKRHAFTYALWAADRQIVTFSKRLSHINTRAFLYNAVPYEPQQEGEETKSVGAIRLQGWTPPFCDFLLPAMLSYGVSNGKMMRYSDDEIYGKNFAPCKIVVPCKVRYLASNTEWDSHILDDYDYGLLCGTMTPDDKEKYYSKLDSYAPRIEEVGRKIGQTETNCEWSVDAGFLFGDVNYVNECYAKLSLLLEGRNLKGSVPITFVNPESGKEENITFNYNGMTDLGWEIVGFDTEGNELFANAFKVSYYGPFSFEGYWPEETPMNVIYSWEENHGTSPVPNGSVALRIKGNGTFGLTELLGETEKKDLYFTAYYLVGEVEPTELQHPEDTPYYDLQGRQIATPSKGVYIKDGKKVLIK